jgi:hypothetical protein
MDVTLAQERVFVLEERLAVGEIEQRAMDRRVQAFGSGIGALLQRPKPDEIALVAKQRRLEPLWHVAGRAVYVYERDRDYNVAPSATDVEAITVNGVRYDGQPSGQRTFRLPAREHCRSEFTGEAFVDGLTGATVADRASLMAGTRTEVSDIASLANDGTIVLPPEQRASYVVRQLMAEIMKPVQADAMLEESVVLDATDLLYRPMWAFEFTWQGKAKQGVVEIDAVTGQTRQGKPLVSTIRSVLTRDVLFDVGADTVGLLVPGGSIAVKLAKAAIDRKKV